MKKSDAIYAAIIALAFILLVMSAGVWKTAKVLLLTAVVLVVNLIFTLMYRKFFG